MPVKEGFDESEAFLSMVQLSSGTADMVKASRGRVS
jgi:hypothetical protein